MALIPNCHEASERSGNDFLFLNELSDGKSRDLGFKYQAAIADALGIGDDAAGAVINADAKKVEPRRGDDSFSELALLDTAEAYELLVPGELGQHGSALSGHLEHEHARQ